MSNNRGQNLEHFVALFGLACESFEHMINEVGTEPVVILIRALQENAWCTTADLMTEMAAETEVEVATSMVDMVRMLHDTFGPNWYLTSRHFWLRRKNDGCRGWESPEDCPLFGDDIEDVQGYWDSEFKAFDRRRAGELQAVQAWLRRQAKRAA
jgi:hypothetical protein